MLRIVSLQDGLVKATVDEILLRGSDDFSHLIVVTPSKRMLFFIKDLLNKTIKASYFPPHLLTIDQFVFQLFNLNFTGFRMIPEMEAVLAAFIAVKMEFPDHLYTGGELSRHFTGFFPWAVVILKAVEELLVEGKNLEKINEDIFNEFTQLGEYHQGYKDFIRKMPQVVNRFKILLQHKKQYTRGLAYRMMASRIQQDLPVFPDGKEVIFSGLSVLNFCEEKIIKFIFDTGRARLVLKTDVSALADRKSPFFIQRQLLDALNLSPESQIKVPTEWNRFSNKVNLYCLPNVETQMVQVSHILKKIVEDRKNPEDLQKIAVVLPDSASLIPFIHGVVSRFSMENCKIPFNITLGYPFSRTPLFQLLEFIMKVAESRENESVFSKDYLNLIRHPYVKLSRNFAEDDEPLKRGIHLLEDLINRENLLYFNPAHIEERISDGLKKSDGLSMVLKERIVFEIHSLHRLFLVQKGISLAQMGEFLKQVVLAVAKDRKIHLFFGDTIATAITNLDLLIQFSQEHEANLGDSDFASISTLISYFFSSVHIYFEGSPLKGIQVMGMLESRGLGFDEVIVIDAIEGILPQHLKYDPLLPYDIRNTFGMKSYSDWENLFAFHFFSLLGSAKKVHVFWTDNKEGADKPEKSRFIERIVYETEKKGDLSPDIDRRNCDFNLFSREFKTVEKSQKLKEKIKEMTFSASGLETYIRCPLKFYFSSVCGLREREELSADPDVGELGTVIHRILESFYRHLDISSAIRQMEDRLKKMVENEFKKRGFGISSGIGKIRSWVLIEKLKDFILFDLERLKKNRITISEFETKMSILISLPDQAVSLKGRIDRIEREGDVWRLIDYKTGSFFNPAINRKMLGFRLENLSGLEKKNYLTALKELHQVYKNFQILLYMEMVKSQYKVDYEKIDAAYIFLKQSENFFQPVFVQGKGKEMVSPGEKTVMMKNFCHNLTEIIKDIYNRDFFIPNPSDAHFCSYCPFQVPCGNLPGHSH